LSSIAAFAIFIGLTGEYIISALGVLLIVISVPMTLIGLVLKREEQQKVVSGRLCPKCSHEIPIDAVVCPYCQYVFTDILRHEY
jgi:hypothetical protein